MSTKINALEIENVKRIKAVRLDCTGKHLVVVGGKNQQGKTSVLDAIVYALGGERYRPSDLKRDGSLSDPEIRLTLSNGIIVERKGKNSTLKVTDPSGKTGGQTLLNALIHQFALDLPKFMQASSKEKADTLLQIIGVGDALTKIEQKIESVYQARRDIGRDAERQAKHAEALEEYPDAPDEAVSARELIEEQQAILAKNGENQQKRANHLEIKRSLDHQTQTVADLAKKLAEAKKALAVLEADYITSQKTVEELQDEKTDAIQAKLEQIESINAKVAANTEKARAQEQAALLKDEYDTKTLELDAARAGKAALLESATLPLPGLSVADGELVYNGQKWDCMSGAEQLFVSTAIVRSLNPDCGFVLLDKVEQFDLDTLRAFGDWLEQEDLQAITTRVSTGDECSIVIEDGLVTESNDGTSVVNTNEAYTF